MIAIRSSLFTLLFLASSPLWAQGLKYQLGGAAAASFDKVAKIETRIVPANAKPGELVTFELTVIPEKDCYTYPNTIPDGQIGNNEIKFPPPADLIFVGEITDPEGVSTRKSKINPSVMEKYYPHPGRPTWKLTAVVSPSATAGQKTVSLIGTVIQACDKSSCYTTPPKSPPTATFTVLEGSATVPAQYATAVKEALALRASPAPVSVPPAPAAPGVIAATAKAEGLIQKKAQSIEEYVAGLEQLKEKITNETVAVGAEGGVAGLLLAAVFWGFVSLVTPCVFPMIPITVSLFLKHSQQSTTGTLKLAAVYCLTIIAVLGLAAVSLLSAFQELSNIAITNLVLGSLFVFFALSLFGMYDITLPGFMLRFTERRRGAGGMIGTVFGALAFSIVSFTCVAPFLGGFAGLAASNQFSWIARTSAGLAFAAAFASPFFILALFPSLLKKLPKSGGWLDYIKAIMGFLELAAALKFLRSAELLYSGTPSIFTYDVVLGGWVAICIVTGLYSLSLFRLPHDEETANIGVVRMLIGVLFIGLAIYLTPALFKNGGEAQRPSGRVYAWVDAFLLPEPTSAGSEELPWSGDLKGAVERIVREKQTSGVATKPFIFLDVTGVNCTNCKLNEKNVFPQPRVRELLEKFTLVQLYADVVPPAVYLDSPSVGQRKQEAEANLEFQQAVFGRVSRPMYAILEPLATGKVRVVGVYDVGTIEKVEEFLEFLKKPTN
jgi:thiol:disulfide interchange protein